MLYGLKKAIKDEQMSDFASEAILEASHNQDVKDMIDDEYDLDLADAEDNEEVEGILELVPEYDEDEELEKDMQMLEESVQSIPETNI